MYAPITAPWNINVAGTTILAVNLSERMPAIRTIGRPHKFAIRFYFCQTALVFGKLNESIQFWKVACYS